MLAVNGHATLATVRTLVSIDRVHVLIFMAVTRAMPVGNGGKFTHESRAIYDLVLEMQKVDY